MEKQTKEKEKMKIISTIFFLLFFAVLNVFEVQSQENNKGLCLKNIYIIDTIYHPREYFILLVESNQFETKNLKMYANQNSFLNTDSVTIKSENLFEGSNGLFISKTFFHNLMLSSKIDRLKQINVNVTNDAGYSSTGTSQICKNIFKKNVNIKNEALVVSLIYGDFFNKAIPNHMISLPYENQFYLIYSPL